MLKDAPVIDAAAAPGEIRPVLNRVLFSQKSDHWSTPPHVKEALDAEFHFTFDPCPLMSTESGLLVKWTGRVFCNPPYSRVQSFLVKGLWHLSQRHCESLVYLLPARTDVAWFHDYCYKQAEIRFIKGRLKFGGAKNNAPFPSMVVIFKQHTPTITRDLDGHLHLMP